MSRRLSFGAGSIVFLFALVLPLVGFLFTPASDEEMGDLDVLASLAPASESDSPDAPDALDAPEDMRCRPNEGKTDQVLLQWNDTNGGAVGYDLEREDVNAPGWDLLPPVAAGTCDDGVCQVVDNDASNSTVYRYRARANDGGGDTSAYGDVCREPLVQNQSDNADDNRFRVFYRLTECPTFEGKSNCTQNDNVDGKNIYVMQTIATLDAFRQEYIELGFKDFSFYKGARPFPVDLYPCNNGCANSQGIQIPPANLLNPDYIPATGAGTDYEVFVMGHEGFHKVQGSYGDVEDPSYKWLIEGQARSTEDKSCIFDTNAKCAIWDNQIAKYYAGAAKSYLGFPEQGLLDASYNAALWWTYFVEQIGTTTTEPQYGMDAMLKYWQQNEVNSDASQSKDGIGTINDMLTTLGNPRRFEDLFQDFTAANYLKDYLTNPVAAGMEKYNYIDEEDYSANGFTYGSVKLTENKTLEPDQPIFGTTSIQAWGARYFQIDPDPAVPVVNVEAETLAGTSYPLYFQVVVIDNGAIVSQHSEVGTTLNYSVDNAAGYDRIALIVASSENPTNFNYGFNLTDGLFILNPNTQLPAAVGEKTSPEKFILQVAVLDEIGDPVSGLDPTLFTITVGSKLVNPPANPADDAIIGASYIAGQYWITVRAPDDPGTCTECDLSVGYSVYSDTETGAILYGPKPDSDNMIVIDRSGSMLGDKFAAAQAAGKLYADSYSEGDRIGIVSFNSAPNQEYPLTGWAEDKRDDVTDAIDNMAAPAGDTAAGAGLREGNAKLTAQGSPNPVWSMVLLSDGKDTVADTDDHIPAYISEWAAAKKAGDQVPVVHVVAVGDDADGVELSKLTSKTGGLFQFLPVPSEMVSAADAEAVDAIHIDEALSEIYRVFAEDVLDEQQTYVNHFPKQTQPHLDQIQVDSAASEGIFVLKYSPPTAALPTIYLLSPSGNGAVDAIAPTLTAPGHLLWRIPSPEAGKWKLNMRFGCGTACPQTFMVESALVSDLTLKAYLGLPVEDRKVGKPMPIIAFLSDIAPLVGATVKVTSETTSEVITLKDDGLHGDGAANDGAYGGIILNTNQPGGYSLIVDAKGHSPFAGDYTRRVKLGFFLPDEPDSDKDRLPDWWEVAYGTDPKVADAEKDPDGDGLPNAQEYFRKTNPLDPDTDDGGEGDGSEVHRHLDPLFPGDDGSTPPVTFKPWPGPKRAIIRLVLPKDMDRYVIERATSMTGTFTAVVNGTVAVDEWIDPGVNEQLYCYHVLITKGEATSTSPVLCTTPKSDPNPPHGIVFSLLLPAINSAALPAASNTVPLTVSLQLDATDDPTIEENPVFDGEFLFPDATKSGVSEMMISNRADFAGAAWEPYATSKQWRLAPNASHVATVFVLFKDGAGNVSDFAHATFTVDESLLPPHNQLFLPRLSVESNN